jgi:acyl-ACP thioesterase
MSIYAAKYVLKNNDVNMYRRLRTSRLFEMLQAGCVAHTEQLGAGREKTLDHGILWVVIQQYIEVTRMPEYDEEVTVETWPGRTMHVLFPRYFRVKDAQGNIIINGSALWTLIDQQTRKMVFADQYQIEIPGEEHEGQAPLPKAVKSVECVHHSTFTVPYSYCDLNGHMNNARYLDLAEDAIPAAGQGKQLKTVTTQYAEEIRFHETIDIGWSQVENSYFISGDHEHNCFRLSLTYHDTGSD